MQSILESVFSPFKYLNVASIYDQHFQIIDGILFFCIFLGLSKFAFSKRFPGRPGNLISIAFSFMLTIGLLVMERTLHFNLRAFGALAMGVILLLTGFFIIALARSSGMKGLTPFCFAYSIIYMSIATVLPNLFDYIATRAKWLNGILGLIFLISLFKILQGLFQFFFSKKNIGDINISPKLGNDSELKKDIALENDEINALKALRHKLATIEDISDALNMIEKVIAESPTLSPDRVTRIKRYLSELGTRETIFRKSYHELERRFKALGRFDSARLERLKDEMSTVPDKLKRFKEEEINIERRKIEYDGKVVELKTNLDKLITKFNQYVTAALNDLQNNPDSALPNIRHAKDVLHQMKRIIEAIKQFEREIIDLNKTQKELFKGERKKKY